MHGVCRLLWSLLILTSLGCQSILSESSGLAGRLGDALKAPAKSAGLTGVIAPLRGGKAKPDEPPPPLSLPGRWAEDEVLQMVVKQELADATPEERAELSQRLSQANEDEIADLLTQRRRRRQAAPVGHSTTPDEASAQQIILTRRPESDLPVDRTSLIAPPIRSDSPPDRPRASHPLAERFDRLAAPRPGAGPAASADPPPVASPLPEQPSSVASIVDAFGAGGETRAAQQEIAETSRIGLAGRNSINEPDTQAEAIARDFDAEKAAQSVYWQEDVDKLITLLEAQIAQQHPGKTDYSRDSYIRQHVALRMLYLIASRRPEALQAIPGVAHDRQEFWTRMFWALSSIFDEEAMPNSTVRAADTVAQLRAAIEQLEPRASLELRGTVFCRQINGFGDFVSFSDEPFVPGQPLLIYTEVRNFQSRSQEDGSYRTVLRSTITIQQGNVSGPVVFKYDLPASEDRCQSRRRDYFHSYRIHLPETLKPGPHVLTLDVTDALTGKNGSTTLNFVVR